MRPVLPSHKMESTPEHQQLTQQVRFICPLLYSIIGEKGDRETSWAGDEINPCACGLGSRPPALRPAGCPFSIIRPHSRIGSHVTPCFELV